MSRILLSAVLAAGGLWAATAQAQPAPPPAPPPAPHGMMAGDHGPDGMRMGGHDPAEAAQKLRDLLQLRPAQEPALQAFLAAVGAAHQGGPMPQGRPATTPERLAMAEQMMSRHQAVMRSVLDAVRRFYAQLDPAQKRAFDALPTPGMMGHGMMGHEMMGGMMGMGEGMDHGMGSGMDHGMPMDHGMGGMPHPPAPGS
jgi:protein CpxP